MADEPTQCERAAECIYAMGVFRVPAEDGNSKAEVWVREAVCGKDGEWRCRDREITEGRHDG